MDALLRQSMTISALRAARDKVLGNNGCPGVDGETVLDFAARGDNALRLLATAVASDRYQTQALLRLWIPKGEGRPPRGLAVPTVADRVLQTAVANALTPLVEAQAEDCSFAYRRGRSVQQAVAHVERLMREGWCWIVEADIEQFFDRIEHSRLLTLLRDLVPSEPRMLALVAQWMAAPVRDGGIDCARERGVPQGSPVSPLLANLYLDALDEALLDEDHRLVRFADDFIVLARTRERAQAALQLSRDVLERMALRLNPLKTRILHCDQGFEFLGWNFVRTLALPRRWQEEPAPVPARKPVSDSSTSAAPLLADAGDAPADPMATDDEAPLANGASAGLSFDADTDDYGDDEGGPAADEPRGLPALAPLQRTLYLVNPEARLEVDNQRLSVTQGERKLLVVSALNVDQVIVFGPVQVSSQALQLVARSGGAVAFLSKFGRYYGRFEGADGSALGLLEAQFQRAHEPGFALAIAQRLIAAKVRNSATVLARTLRRHPLRDVADPSSAQAAPARLREWADGAERAGDLAALRGTEGAAAALHFQTLGRLLPEGWPFLKRVARPAPDAVNALLSFGYSVLYQAVAGLLRARGLHAHLGLFHASGGAHMALASDLMEPYRAYAVDSTVLRLIFSGRISAQDGRREGDAWRLGTETQRALIHAIEGRFNASQHHPQIHEPMDLRRIMDSDVRQLAQALRAGQAGDFRPAVWD